MRHSESVLGIQDTEIKKSKSQRKREHLALQVMGKKLIESNEKQLQNIPLPAKIIDEARAARSFKKGALKRQIQYLGGLLSQCSEADIELIRRALDQRY